MKWPPSVYEAPEVGTLWQRSGSGPWFEVTTLALMGAEAMVVYRPVGGDRCYITAATDWMTHYTPRGRWGKIEWL